MVSVFTDQLAKVKSEQQISDYQEIENKISSPLLPPIVECDTRHGWRAFC
jgi:hypothetical protein